MSLKTEDVCKHCGTPIMHYSGKLWHQVGAQVFPQYCAFLKDGTGNSSLHEPTACVLDDYGFPTVLLLRDQPGADAKLDGTWRRPFTDGERMAHLESYVSDSARTAHYPVPAGWVQWLLSKYEAVLGAMKPLPARKYMTKPFTDMNDVLKLTMIYREVEGANSSGLPMLTVPSSCVVWLLAEHRKKATHLR